jgi:hypothetical protein
MYRLLDKAALLTRPLRLCSTRFNVMQIFAANANRFPAPSIAAPLPALRITSPILCAGNEA